MVNIRDIAKDAGVSITTVSHALSNKRAVSNKTRERIFYSIEKLGYKPNALARSLKTKRTNTVGLIIPHKSKYFVENYTFIDLIPKLLENLIFNNYYLLIYKDYQDYNPIMSYEFLIKENRVDGFILVDPKHNDLRIQYLFKQKKPFVIFGRSPEYPDIPSVDVDNINGIFKATELLIRKGHKKIAYIGVSPNYIYAEDRLEGYKKALKQYNLPEDPQLIFLNPTYDENAGYWGIKNVYDHCRSITAVVCPSDQIAIGVIKGLKEKSIIIPDNVSVIGYDDSLLASYFYPPLSTVRQPIDTLSSLLVQEIINLVEQKNPKQVQHHILETQLIERGTTKSLIN